MVQRPPKRTPLAHGGPWCGEALRKPVDLLQRLTDWQSTQPLEEAQKIDAGLEVPVVP